MCHIVCAKFFLVCFFVLRVYVLTHLSGLNVSLLLFSLVLIFLAEHLSFNAIFLIAF